MSNPHIQSTITCAAPNCGQLKRETNHWLIMIASPSRGNLTVFSWQPDILGRPDALPLCGESCASKMLSIWMDEVKHLKEEYQK
jgi:hypothetical protein